MTLNLSFTEALTSNYSTKESTSRNNSAKTVTYRFHTIYWYLQHQKGYVNQTRSRQGQGQPQEYDI